ncbi:MAG: CD225/dispanin family protein [Bacteroidaceae bacterium]|nr:CD225/dispanin family protein [Bacteroidaceae bacterium]MBR6601357.1 CD225/dispanin family protein [Bacteroidaceae bacterium]
MNEAIKQKPDNFLIWSILSTVLCCLPTGIVAIVYANKVDSLWHAGNHLEAEEAAKNARLWTFISLGLGVLSFIIGLAFGFFSALMA